MQGIHKQIHTSPLFYKASRLPHQLRVPLEVPTPIAHHKVGSLRGCQIDNVKHEYYEKQMKLIKNVFSVLRPRASQMAAIL